MVEKINVQIKQGGKLLKEVSEENVIVITETMRGELFAHIGIQEAALLAAQLSNEYDRMLEWLIKSFRLDNEEAGDLIKLAKMHLQVSRQEVVIEPKELGGDK